MNREKGPLMHKDPKIHDILLVEDDAVDARMIIQLIDSKLFRVKHIKALNSAMELLENQEKFDLILVDLNLEDSAGLSTVQQLRDLLGGTPILIVSGHNIEDLDQQSVFELSDNYLDKSQLREIDINRSLTYAISGRGREQKIIDQKNSAMELLEQRSQFIAFLAHEIRTPLNGILGLTELLEPFITCEESREFYDPLVTSVSALQEIVDNLLDLAKSEKGLMTPDLGMCSIPDLSNELSKIYSVQIESRGLKFVKDLNQVKDTEIYTDKLKMMQISQNLLSNAIKYTQTGEIALRFKQFNKYLHIEVEDTGRGVEPKNREKIFEPFQQLEKTDEQIGTGLGLPICRTLAGLLGGQIWVEDGKNGGSLFVVKIPYLDVKT